MFDPGIFLFIILYILTLIIVYILIWFIFVYKKGNTEGEYCDSNSDCLNNLICVGGNQCTSKDNPLNGLDGICRSNSECELGLLCIGGICSYPSSGNNLLFSLFG